MGGKITPIVPYTAKPLAVNSDDCDALLVVRERRGVAEGHACAVGQLQDDFEEGLDCGGGRVIQLEEHGTRWDAGVGEHVPVNVNCEWVGGGATEGRKDGRPRKATKATESCGSGRLGEHAPGKGCMY